MKKKWVAILTAAVIFCLSTATFVQAGQSEEAPVEIAGMVIEYEMISCDSAAPEQ